ncbi:MAG: hypothetical protein ACKOZU_03185 [Planctomycetaceae bacterium]
MLAASFFAILLARRGQQLFQPQVWAEDGTLIVSAFINKGSIALLEPGKKYFLLAPKLISWLSLSVSFSHFPLVSTLIAWAFTVAVLMAIARHPSLLKGGVLLAFAVLFIPTDAEAFGVPLYSLWWAPLLMLVALFWSERAAHLPLRTGLVILGGLSSPLILAAWPLFLMRAWLQRYLRREWVVAGVATACCGLQIAAMALSRPSPRQPRLANCLDIDIVPLFFGRYLVGEFTNRPPLLVAASLAVLAVVGAGVWHARRIPAVWFLVFLLLGSMVLGVVRVGSLWIHPVYAGPRYFFYPFILLSWLLLQIAGDHTGKRWLRGSALALLAVSLINSLPHFGRFHEDLRWRDHVASSVHFDSYAIPVHLDGAACRARHFEITGPQATALLARDPFAGRLGGVPVYPHTVATVDGGSRLDCDRCPRIVGDHRWAAVPPGPDVPVDLAVLRSPDAADGSPLTLTLRRGDRLLFRSSPTIPGFEMVVEETGTTFARSMLPSTAWQTVVFSNRLLPETFTLTIRNRVSAPLQWAEIGLPSSRSTP